MDCPDGYRVMREECLEGPRFYVQQRKQVQLFLWWTWEWWETQGGEDYGFFRSSYDSLEEALAAVAKEVEAARLESKPWTVVAE